MTHACARCWIHEDCLVDIELSIACGPNPLDMQVLDANWADDADFGGGYGSGIGSGWGGGHGDNGGGGFGDGDFGDGAGDGYRDGGRGGGEVDGGQW